jgi:AcrR family transcriptional regulator
MRDVIRRDAEGWCVVEQRGKSQKFKDRQQRRFERRRQEILAAAARVFAEKGYANSTTKEIADVADIAEGTLYNYFGGKREILLAVADGTQTPMQLAVQQAATLENRAAMISMFEKAFDISEARLPFVRTLLAEAWIDDGILQEFLAVRLGRIAQSVQAFIAERVATGAFRRIDPVIGARVAIGMFAGLIAPSLRGLEPLPSQKERRVLAEAIVDVLLDGVRARAE